ncbi:MAG: M56 family metallopeptidase [Cellulosilyticaceae bacterium]
MLTAVFEWVMLTTFYGSVVGVTLLLVKSVLKQRISPRWHYALWSILIIKLIMPIGPESSLSLFNLFVAERFSVKQLESVDRPIVSLSTRTEDEKAQVIPQQVTGIQMPDRQLSEINEKATIDSSGIKKGIQLIWLIGFIGMTGSLSISYYSFSRKLRRVPVNKEKELKKLLEICKGQIGVGKNLPIRVQDTLSSPALVGSIQPSILISKKIVALEDEALKYVLLHEMAHYKRKDHWVNLLLLGLQAIHWFNPMMLYCFKCMRQDIEICTDDLVLKGLDVEAQKNYGKTLLKVLELMKERHHAKGVLTMASDKKSFHTRIRHIASKGWFVKNRKQVMALGIVCVVGLSGLLLTGIKEEKSAYAEELVQRVDKAWQFKTPYVGDNSKVGGLVELCGYEMYGKGIELQTSEQPYGITVSYDWLDMSIPNELTQSIFYENALLIFTLIENVDQITYRLEGIEGLEKPYELVYTRSEVQKLWDQDLREFGKSKENLAQLFSQLDMRVIGIAELYEADLSKTLGIALKSRNPLEKQVQTFETEHGSFVAETTYKGGDLISDNAFVNKGKVFETLNGTAVYWTPEEEDGSLWKGEKNQITMKVKTREGGLIGQAETLITYENQLYMIQNNMPKEATSGQPQPQPQIDIEEMDFEGEVKEIKPYRENQSQIELRGLGYASITLANQDIEKYNIKVGDLIQIKMRYTSHYSEVVSIFHFNKQEGDSLYDLGIQYAKLNGYEPLIEDLELPIGEYTLRVSNIFGDETRIAFELEVEGLVEESKKGYCLDLAHSWNDISISTWNVDPTHKSVELIGDRNAFKAYKEIVFEVSLNKDEKMLGKAKVTLPISWEKIPEGKYYKGTGTSYFKDGSITLEELAIDPTKMEIKVSSTAKGRQVESLYKPVLKGNQKGIYSQSPSVAGGSYKNYFTQYIIPSAYFDENSSLWLEAEGYTYTIDEEKPISLRLDGAYPYTYPLGDGYMTIKDFYYESGHLHIVIEDNPAINYLSSVKIDDKDYSVGSMISGEEGNTQTIYRVNLPYRESYDVILNINWIERTEISTSIDLK